MTSLLLLIVIANLLPLLVKQFEGKMIELEEWKQNALFIFAYALLIALLRHGYLPTPRSSGCMISHQC